MMNSHLPMIEFAERLRRRFIRNLMLEAQAAGQATAKSVAIGDQLTAKIQIGHGQAYRSAADWLINLGPIEDLDDLPLPPPDNTLHPRRRNKKDRAAHRPVFA